MENDTWDKNSKYILEAIKSLCNKQDRMNNKIDNLQQEMNNKFDKQRGICHIKGNDCLTKYVSKESFLLLTTLVISILVGIGGIGWNTYNLNATTQLNKQKIESNENYKAPEIELNENYKIPEIKYYKVYDTELLTKENH